MKKVCDMEYYNILIMDDDSPAKFTIGKTYELMLAEDGDDYPYEFGYFFISDNGDEHWFEGPGVVDDYTGFTMDDYFRKVD